MWIRAFIDCPLELVWFAAVQFCTRSSHFTTITRIARIMHRLTVVKSYYEAQLDRTTTRSESIPCGHRENNWPNPQSPFSSCIIILLSAMNMLATEISTAQLCLCHSFISFDPRTKMDCYGICTCVHFQSFKRIFHPLIFRLSAIHFIFERDNKRLTFLRHFCWSLELRKEIYV